MTVYIKRTKSSNIMKLHFISFAHGIILIAFGIWSHLWPESSSPTALIPVLFGVAILVLNKGVRKRRKAITTSVMILTFLVLIGLIFPLSGAISRSDLPAIIRVSIMMFASLVSLIFLVKRFIDARIKNETFH